MERTPRLYDTLVHILSQQQNWLDRRHLKTLAGMTVGFIQAGNIRLTAWVPSVHSRAVFAQSPVRRCARWIEHARLGVQALQGLLRHQALAEWGTQVLDLALDTSMLWETYGLVRLSLVSRGRAVPLVWTVLEHPSSRVASEVQNGLLEKVAARLRVRGPVVFPADRGFADTHLRQQPTQLGWHWRIRITGSFGISRQGTRPGKVNRLPVSPGQARCWPHVAIPKQRYGPVHLARGRPLDRQDYWCVVSAEPTACKTCAEDGRRFDIEANFLDDTSQGFHLEASLSRSAKALERWCGVLAITTRYLVSQGTEVVDHGKRRWVDAHWFRGQSDLTSGWNWVKLALSRGYELLTRLHPWAQADPAPAMASKLQHQKQPLLFFTMEFQDAVA